MNTLLYAAYILFFACLFLTNDFFLAQYFFLCVVAPIALAPFEILRINRRGWLIWPVVRISFYGLHQLLLQMCSYIFVFAFVFGLLIVLSSSMQPNPSFDWFLILLGYFLTIVLFILVSARLATCFENFYEVFIVVLISLATVNAIVALRDYILGLPNIAALLDTRLSPSFGHVPDHYPTSGAMTYATCLVCAGGLMALNTSRTRKFIAGFCAIILFITLALTQSRGPLFGALLAIFTGCLFTFKFTRPIILVAPFIAAGSFLMTPKVGARALERLDSMRFDIWRRYLALSYDRLILGYGERIEFLVEISDGEKLGHAHNIFLSSLLRAGLLATLCLIASYGLALIYSLKFAHEYKNPVPAGLITLILLAGSVDFDQIVFLADWQWLSFWMPIGFAIAAERQLYNLPLNLPH
jgi:hypothetical protein